MFGIMLIFSGCFANQPTNADVIGEKQQTEIQSERVAGNQEARTMKLAIGETEVPVTWENNASVADLQKNLPLTIQMSQYGGFEQVGSIGRSIVRDDQEITTHYGDIVLYAGNQIVIFYDSNSWAYTRLGHINLSQQEMTELLSKHDVSITIAEK
ncbi:MAG: hypothetical protein IJQ78_04670 [Selenomonadaceae bacterium]|nr:hypothetical protein [Selenomonadaceae bacterium]